MNNDNGQERSSNFYASHSRDLEDWFKVADRDYVELLSQVNFNEILAEFGPAIRLLDVGCGTGRFPELLRPSLRPEFVIEYDYLDPVANCLAQMAEVLVDPYRPCTAYEIPIDQFPSLSSPSAGYDVVWSIHSLYAVPLPSLQDAVTRFHDLIRPGGIGLIYLQHRLSSYSRVYDTYWQHDEQVPSFNEAEDIVSLLQTIGAHFEVKTISFEHHVISEAVLKPYLQKCVFDDSRPFQYWHDTPRLRDLLDAHRDGDGYRFPQQVALIQIRR